MMGCSNCKRFREYDDYCSQHENCCKTSNCAKRISGSQEYCSQHSNPCLRRNCNIGIIDRENFCYNCSIIHNNRHYSYQYSVTYYCTYSSCSTKVNISGDYCTYHQNQITEQNQLKSLVSQKTALANPQEVTTFITWWNNNLATVINGNYSYTLWIIVYEPATKSMSKVLKTFEISSGYDKNSLTSAKNKASSLRSELDGENPILAIIGSYGSISVSTLLSEPFVIKRDLPFTINTHWERDSIGIQCREIDGVTYTREPSQYLKPFDIVKVNHGVFSHVGVYLGNKKVCHYSKAKNGTRIDSWEDFLEGGEDWIRDPVYGLTTHVPIGLYGYHPVIPFKKFETIARQITWAEDTNFRKNEYDLANRNCEHFANMIVYGINYSEQVESSSLIGLGYSTKNNGKGSTIKLEDETKDSDRKFGENQSSYWYKEIKSQIEISPKQGNCRIM